MDLISHYLTVFNILFAMVLASGDFNRGFGENGQNNVAVQPSSAENNVGKRQYSYNQPGPYNQPGLHDQWQTGLPSEIMGNGWVAKRNHNWAQMIMEKIREQNGAQKATRDNSAMPHSFVNGGLWRRDDSYKRSGINEGSQMTMPHTFVNGGLWKRDDSFEQPGIIERSQIAMPHTFVNGGLWKRSGINEESRNMMPHTFVNGGLWKRDDSLIRSGINEDSQIADPGILWKRDEFFKRSGINKESRIEMPHSFVNGGLWKRGDSYQRSAINEGSQVAMPHSFANGGLWKRDDSYKRSAINEGSQVAIPSDSSEEGEHGKRNVTADFRDEEKRRCRGHFNFQLCIEGKKSTKDQQIKKNHLEMYRKLPQRTKATTPRAKRRQFDAAGLASRNVLNEEQSLCKRAIEVCSNAVSKRSTEKNATVQKDATKRERKDK